MGLLVNREPKDVLDIKASQTIAEVMQDAILEGRYGPGSYFADTLVGRRRPRMITAQHLGRSSETQRLLTAL